MWASIGQAILQFIKKPSNILALVRGLQSLWKMYKMYRLEKHYALKQETKNKLLDKMGEARKKEVIDEKEIEDLHKRLVNLGHNVKL